MFLVHMYNKVHKHGVVYGFIDENNESLFDRLTKGLPIFDLCRVKSYQDSANKAKEFIRKYKDDSAFHIELFELEHTGDRRFMCSTNMWEYCLQ